MRPAGPDSLMGDDSFLTVTEVATVLRVSKMTVYRLVHSGELEAVRVSRRTFRIRESVARAYLKEQSTWGDN
jgi:excisionase family DNA binding protein